MFMRFIQTYCYIATQNLVKPRRLVAEGTSCNGEVIRRNNLLLEGETTFILKAKRFSIETDRREFKIKAKRPRVMHVSMEIETTLRSRNERLYNLQL